MDRKIRIGRTLGRMISAASAAAMPGTDPALPQEGTVLAQAAKVEPKEVGRDLNALGANLVRIEVVRESVLQSIGNHWEKAAQDIASYEEKELARFPGFSPEENEEKSKLRLRWAGMRELYRGIRTELLLGIEDHGVNSSLTLRRRYNRLQSLALQKEVQRLIHEIEWFLGPEVPFELRVYIIKAEELEAARAEQRREEKTPAPKGEIKRT